MTELEMKLAAVAVQSELLWMRIHCKLDHEYVMSDAIATVECKVHFMFTPDQIVEITRRFA